MAEQSLTTPGAVSRRFLFSAAVALPVATATAGSLPGGVSPKLLALLERYRDTCIRLREVEADQAEKLLSIPASFRPGSSDGRCVSRWPEWTRAELDALGLPPGMPSRPSQDDFVRFFNRTSSPDPEKREESAPAAQGQGRCVERPAGHSEGMVRQGGPRCRRQAAKPLG
jgi:hypothetical protein